LPKRREKISATVYEVSHSLVTSGETKAVLQVGKDDWPFPIPLVKNETGWRFDTQAGQEEILNRRIGAPRARGHRGVPRLRGCTV
jgi:hypothetical protein